MTAIRKELEGVFDPVISAEILDLARICAEKNVFLTLLLTTKKKTTEVQLFPMNGKIPARREGELSDGTWGVKIKNVRKDWNDYDRRQGER